MELSPYLLFNGNCAEAFKLYAQVLGGRIDAITTHGESPARDYVSPDWHGKVLHARMVVGGSVLMGSDAPPGRYTAPQGMSVSIGTREVGDAERVFRALSDGGTVTMPFEKTFWSPGFGMLVDRFGIHWMVNTEAEVA